MSTRRLRLEAESPEELGRLVFARYGPSAQIVEAERITVSGLAGMFAKRYYEVVLEVPEGGPRVHGGFARGADAAGRGGAGAAPASSGSPGAGWAGAPGAAPTAARAAGPGASANAGLDALLDAAEDAEDGFFAEPPLAVSTDRADFVDLLDDLARVSAPGPRPPAVPVLRSRAGDLVLVVGVGEVAAEAARSMARSVGGELAISGALELAGARRVDGRRAALAARADGVERGLPVIVAYALPGPFTATPARLASLPAFGADQNWVVLDATRKAEDTRRWVAPVLEAVPIDAAAVVGTRATVSPETVLEFGVPVGWVDGVAGGWPAR